MKVSKLDNAPEIFQTIQGEGRNIGVPAVFVRFSLCNLHCQFCDTPYTWNWQSTPFKHRKQEKYDAGSESMDLNVKGILDEIHKKIGKAKVVVLTGGEPLLQQNEWLPIVRQLKKERIAIEIETNGTMAPNNEVQEFIDQYNVSPKLSNSGNEKNLRIKEDILLWYGLNEKALFKFVVKNEKDMQEIDEIVVQSKIDPQRVYLMPEGIRKSVIQRRSKDVTQLAIERGYNFTTRMHILLWGNKRGI